MPNKIKLTNLLREIGVPAHILGYKYLQDAIELVIETPTIIHAATTELYPAVARINDSTVSKVERAIRHAIEVAWGCGSQELMLRIFRTVPICKPCNSHFIATLADTLAKDMY